MIQVIKEQIIIELQFQLRKKNYKLEMISKLFKIKKIKEEFYLKLFQGSKMLEEKLECIQSKTLKQ